MSLLYSFSAITNWKVYFIYQIEPLIAASCAITLHQLVAIHLWMNPQSVAADFFCGLLAERQSLTLQQQLQQQQHQQFFLVDWTLNLQLLE